MYFLFFYLMISCSFAKDICSLQCSTGSGPVCNFFCPNITHYRSIETRLITTESLLRDREFELSEAIRAQKIVSGLLDEKGSVVDVEVAALSKDLDTCREDAESLQFTVTRLTDESNGKSARIEIVEAVLMISFWLHMGTLSYLTLCV